MGKSSVLDYLPLAVWMHIFSLLPAKSLLIVRAVCKHFLTIIDDDEFVSFHLHTFPAELHGNRILTLRTSWWNRLNQTTCEVLAIESPQTPELKWFETRSYFHHGLWVVAGSADGILLMIGRGFAMLWNPSIRKDRQIPSPSNSIKYFNHIKFGFGYDDSSKDYKALAIFDYTLEPNQPIHYEEEVDDGVWVYSVKTASWKAVELPNCPHKRNASQSVSFKGGLVWIEGVDTGHSYYHHLARFDFATEKFSYISVPYPIRKNLWITNRLVILDGGSSLGVWGLDCDDIVSLWSMDDGMASWSRVYNIKEGVLQMGGFRNREMMWEYWTKNARLKVSVYNDGQHTDGSLRPVEYLGDFVESLVLAK